MNGIAIGIGPPGTQRRNNTITLGSSRSTVSSITLSGIGAHAAHASPAFCAHNIICGPRITGTGAIGPMIGT